MARTWTTAGLAVILLMLVFTPRSGEAATWSFSTHRVQMAEDPKPDQPVDETPTPAVIEGKKSIGKGVMFSLIFPGAGQLYANSMPFISSDYAWIRAVPWFVVEVVGWAMFAKYHGDGKDKTAEFEKFAGPRRLGFSLPQEGHFNVNAYMFREYQIASDPSLNSTPYPGGGLVDWEGEDWSYRSTFFENAQGFTHDVLTGDIQQYYEMIGKYINQFGFGWMDTWIDYSNDPSGVTSVPLVNGVYRFDQLGAADDIWWNDDQTTVRFDGASPMFYQYRDMRGESNDLLDKGNVAMEVILVNRVLSAVDAAFAVRRYNKHLEQGLLGGLKLHYDAKTIDGELARVMTLSVPLD